MSSHTNATEAHDFYYLGVNDGIAKKYAGCELSYDGDEAFSYSTLVAKVIPTRGHTRAQINTTQPDTGLTLVSRDAMTNTTGRHISYLRNASPFPTVHVPLNKGERVLDPGVLRDNFLNALLPLSKALNKAECRREFAGLLHERETILHSACETWAKPLRDRRFKKFTAIDVGKAAEEIKVQNRKRAAAAAAATRAVLAKYLDGKHGADYCELMHVLFDSSYTSDKFPLTDNERAALRRKFRGDDAYVWVDGDTIRTSRHISVDLQEARVLLKAWAAGKDMRAQQIGRYTIMSYTGNHIKIGCHNIPRANMLALYEAVVGKPFPNRPEPQKESAA